MNRIGFKAILAMLILLAAGFATSALAGSDDFYPNSAAWTVNAVPNGSITNNFSSGANGSSTLNVDVYADDSLGVLSGWAIVDNSATGGTDTNYTSRTVTFTGVTTSKPAGAPDVVFAAITSCDVYSASSTCSRQISFTAPNVVGNYQVQINTNGGPGPGPLSTQQLRLNFSVAETPVPEDIDTMLTVDQQCLLLHAGDVDLTATLEELVSGDAIPGEDVDFYLDGGYIGTETTDAGGMATLAYNVDALGVGDYNLYGEFLGDFPYNASNDSATLGISYLFVGFGQPINGDGTSIFGGRVIPIKIRLADANGNPVTDAAPTVWLTSYSSVQGLGTELEKVSSVSAADTDNIMRYSATDQQYIYNWDARDLANGTYAVVVDLGDSPTCRSENPYAIITVAKKK